MGVFDTLTAELGRVGMRTAASRGVDDMFVTDFGEVVGPEGIFVKDGRGCENGGDAPG